MSKLGLHINAWNGEILKFAECQPAICKSIDHNPDMLKKFREISPGTLWIGRVVLDNEAFEKPLEDAWAVFAVILSGLRGCHYDVVEGINEPDIGEDIEKAKRLCEFNVYLARHLKVEGFQYAAYSFAATRPHLALWPYLEPALWESDYLAMHAYGPGPLYYEPYWYAFAYRLSWKALSEKIKQHLKGVFLTEYGIARGLKWTEKDVGWKANEGPQVTPENYLNELIVADGEFDPYIKGATIFQRGDASGKWHTFEIEELVPRLTNHIKNSSSTVKVPDPGKEEEAMSDEIIQAIDVSEWGGHIKEEQWKAAYDAGYHMAIVQAWGGGPVPGGKNAYCAQQLEGARRAGMMTAIYFHLPSDTTAKTELLIQAVKDAAGTEYQYIKFVAVDIEGEKLLHPTLWEERLEDAISHIQDKPIVIYTSKSMWDVVMAGVSEFEDFPLWDAKYDNLPDLDANWVPYGGWKERAMKQYQGTTSVPGNISADLNVAHLGRLFPKQEADIEDLRRLLAERDAEVEKKTNAMIAARNTLNAALGKGD
jgi:GH25 family lysozyme M1 (1,4-beta-N-acetylmuramidase)